MYVCYLASARLGNGPAEPGVNFYVSISALRQQLKRTFFRRYWSLPAAASEYGRFHREPGRDGPSPPLRRPGGSRHPVGVSPGALSYGAGRTLNGPRRSARWTALCTSRSARGPVASVPRSCGKPPRRPPPYPSAPQRDTRPCQRPGMRALVAAWNATLHPDDLFCTSATSPSNAASTTLPASFDG